jgi:hypothetical protein
MLLGMGKKHATPLNAKDVKGLKYFRSLQPLLERLHDVGAERDAAGNRNLHMDQYCLLILIWLFSPIVDSLRGLQRASELDKVRKKLGVGRSSLGSLCESVTIFDPEPLKQIAAELASQVPGPPSSAFDAVGQEITAVDGSVVDTVVQVARLSWLPKAQGKSLSAYRLHTHFEVLRGVPARIDATAAKPKGEDDERAVLARSLQPDRCYVIGQVHAVEPDPRGRQQLRLSRPRQLRLRNTGNPCIDRSGRRGGRLERPDRIAGEDRQTGCAA